MAEHTNQQSPDPRAIGVVKYLQHLTEHPELVDTLEKRLNQYALICPFLFDFYKEDQVSGRATLHIAAKLLGVSVTGMVAEFERMREPEDEEEAHLDNTTFRREFPYEESPTGIIWYRPVKDGELSVQLTNFTARIVSDLIEDDGVEEKHCFEITVRQSARTATIRVLAKQFDAMTWVVEALGAKAVLAPGLGAKDHARYAIQQFSQNDVRKRYVYTHVGWRKVGEHWYFLHANGAIGPNGTEDGIEVFVPPLERYVLPDPPKTEDLKAAIRASLHVLEIAPPAITYSCLSALYRAVLGDTDFSLHLAGQTGVGKTELAALIQQHHGPELDARHLPASWSSTGNSLEGLAFTAKLFS